MMNNKKIQEGLESIERIKLLMEYSLAKTLTENKESLYEQRVSDLSKLKSSQLQQATKPNLEFINNKTSSCPEGYVYDPNYIFYKDALDYQGKSTKVFDRKGGCVQATIDNIQLRGIPAGFHPDEWEDFKKEAKEVIYRYFGNLNEVRFRGLWKNPLNPPSPTPNSEWANQYINDYSNVLNKYYHANFLTGIKQWDYKNWAETHKNIDALEKENVKNLMQNLRPVDAGTLGGLGGEKQIQQKMIGDESTKFQSIKDYIDVKYRYTGIQIKKNELELWWDRNGTLFELIAFLAVDYFSGGIAVAIAPEEATTVLIRTIQRYIQSGYPATTGLYKIAKDGKLSKDAFFDFMFAVLPVAKRLFGIGLSSPELCDSIMKKMSNYNLKNVDEFQSFVKSLSTEERNLFSKVNSLTEQEIESGTHEFFKDLSAKDIQGLKSARPNPNIGIPVSETNGLASMAAELGILHLISKWAESKGWFVADEEKKRLADYLGRLESLDLEKGLAIANETLKTNKNISSSELINKIEGQLQLPLWKEMGPDQQNWIKETEKDLEEIMKNISKKR